MASSAAVEHVVTLPERPVERRYSDPLDLIWLAAAARLGMRVVRSSEAYASWDGRGTLTISTASEMDADDCLAQMILHEACHAIVSGPEGMQVPDWGLDNTSDRDLMQEHATNRLQAALAEPHGLRKFFATTTLYRAYYDALPSDPLAGEDPAAELAREAARRARVGKWGAILEDALRATADLAALARPAAPPDSLWAVTEPVHRLRLAPVDPYRVCGTCAWSARRRTTDRALHCRQSGVADQAAPVEPGELACQRWEPVLTTNDCGACGACCRQGFDVVQVGPRDRFRRSYPALVEKSALGFVVPRPNGRCVALDGMGSEGQPYRCRHYADRPRSCEEFEVGGDACLEARRRVRLSR